jgi:signal transduction histidine kinase
MIHPNDYERMREAWVRTREQKTSYNAEGRLWHAPSKDYRYVEVRATPVRNADSSICEWIGTVTDIHERRRADEERKALLVREQQARHTAQLLNRVGQMLSAELDPQSLTKSVTDLATKLVNAEFGALFHNVIREDGEAYTLYTLSGAPYEAFANFPMPRNTAVFAPTFRGEGVVRSPDITLDVRYGKNAPFHGMPEGHLPVRSYLAVPVISRSGEVLGGLFFGHSQPGVFQEQAEEFAVGIASQAAIALDNARLFAASEAARTALRRSNEKLKRANEDLNQFAYSASHDLQEPLRMVTAYTQLLQRRYRSKLDDDADRYIGYAVQGAQRMEALLRDILAYTQSANIEDREYDPVDANQVMRTVLSNLQQAIAAAGAKITLGSLPMIAMAEVHMVQLFQNLIGNAIKYAGKSVPEIEVRAIREEGAWLFSVRDYGIGIDPRYREQIFGLFKRLHRSEEYDGSGIGLAICQKIVERYGGRIWVESDLGRGADFRFTLPDKVKQRNE